MPTKIELRASNSPAISVVSNFDLNRFLGVWYEIARLPHRFEKNLDQVTATYTLLEDGKIQVINRGFHNTKGKWKQVTGKAWIPDPARPAHLKVSFFWIFSSDYKIFLLDEENYQYALVTSNSRKYFWLLSRTPQIDEALYQKLIKVAEELAFDVTQIYRVKHEKSGGERN